MSINPNSAQQLIRNAYIALKNGEKREARRLAEQAAALAPESEEPWLLLAAVASPEASIEFLNNALEVNPQSQQARQGMHWAIKRLREKPLPRRVRRRIIVHQPSAKALTKTRPLLAGPLIPIFVLGLLLGRHLSKSK